MVWWLTHPHARQNVVCDLVSAYEILLKNGLITQCADLVLEEMHVILVVVFVAEMLLEAIDASHVFHGTWLCSLVRFLLIKCISVMMLAQLVRRRPQRPQCEIMMDLIASQLQPLITQKTRDSRCGCVSATLCRALAAGRYGS